MVEFHLPKVAVAGSNPVSRSNINPLQPTGCRGFILLDVLEWLSDCDKRTGFGILNGE